MFIEDGTWRSALHKTFVNKEILKYYLALEATRCKNVLLTFWHRNLTFKF
jgi:hypothetical protein